MFALFILFAIHAALFVLLFFLTTPSVIMTTLDSTNYKDTLANAKVSHIIRISCFFKTPLSYLLLLAPSI